MRESRLIVCVLLLGCSRDWNPSKPGEIFRFTIVGRRAPLDSIELGRTWKSAANYGAHPGDTLSLLPSGTFGGADAIAVHRNASAIVTEIDFVYHPDRDVQALVNDYRSLLGEPFAIGSDTTDGLIQTTTRWQNRDTEFVIAVLTPPHEDIAAFAQLIDRRTKRGETERR
jgi:hypothetical protein